MAKKFFYVCGGLLMLALAYHVGATDGEAQGGGALDAAFISACGDVSAVSGRTIMFSGGSTSYLPYVHPYPVPGSAAVVSCAYAGCTSGGFYAVLATGEIYLSAGDTRNPGPWTYIGSALGAPTAGRGATWGQVKARYR